MPVNNLSYKHFFIELFLFVLSLTGGTVAGIINGFSRDITILYATIGAFGVVWFIRGYYAK